MTINPTPDQQKAITTHGCNVLVSASAGSGKTAVLVQRIITMLTSDNHPVGLDHLLVVTFTKAAAKDMKDKLQTALTEMISNIKPDTNQHQQQQRWLIQQLHLLNIADITTIDAFCMELVKRYFYVIGLDPSFRMLDDNEKTLLKQQVWEQVRENCYVDEEHQVNFVQLIQNFSNDRSDDGLYDIVQRLLRFADVHPEPETWLKQLVTPYQITGSLVKSALYQQQLLPILQADIAAIKQQLTTALSVLDANNDTNYRQKFIVPMQAQVVALQDKLVNGNWDELRQLVNYKAAKPRVNKKDGQLIKRLKDIIDNVNNAFEDMQQYFKLPEKTIITVSQKSQQLVSELSCVVIKYRKALNNEKRRRNVVDFNDIEHFAYQILHTSDPKYTQVIKDIQNQYTEIMIDEYQDTNELQEAILKAISNPQQGNRFMVGDMKQSIYGFRQANPRLFQTKLNTYQTTTNETVSQPTNGIKITLADNFRSVAGIDNFVNMLFKQIMDNQIGGSDYYHHNMLKFGAKYYADSQQQATDNATDIIFYNNETPQKAMSDEETAAMVVAKQIKQLIAHQQIWDKDQQAWRNIQYQDIMILARSHKYNLALTDVFSQMNIPVHINDVPNYFQTVEIQIMISLLQIIDNPDQDIPLVAVLRSPMFSFDENELALIRINHPEDSYYQAVKAFLNGNNSDISQETYQKTCKDVQRFMDILEKLRDYASQHQLSTLIWNIYQVTGWLDYVGGMPNGKQRQANLHALYERAQQYEDNGFQGLFQFIRFIEQLQQDDHDLDEAVTYQDVNAVQVMTIHGSKGLQAPVVILMGIDKQFNQSDFKSPALIDENGIGIQYLAPRSRLRIPTLQYTLQKYQMQKDEVSEEMRLLYVALTRAEQRLVIVGKLKDDYQKTIANWQNQVGDNHELLLPLNVRLGKSYLQWLGLSLIRHPHYQDHRQGYLIDDVTNFNVKFQKISDDNDENNVIWQAYPRGNNVATLNNLVKKVKPIADETLQKLLCDPYPNLVATQTTAYQAVSKAKNYFDDPDNQVMPMLTTNDYNHQQTLTFTDDDFDSPRFINQQEHNEHVKVSAATVGTATHLLLQKIDLHHQPTLATLDQLLKDCIGTNLIAEKVAAKINLAHIMNLFTNKLGKQMLQYPDRVYREQPFAMIMPAKQLFKQLSPHENSPLLIHGIIDGYLLLPNNEVILFDYKTDHINNEYKLQNALKRYYGQLALYADALKTMLPNIKITQKYLYFLDINQLINID